MTRGRQIVVVCASIVLGACEGEPAPRPSASAAAATAQVGTRAVVQVDLNHDDMSLKDAKPYTIAPAAELELELGGYHFTRRDAGPATPDAVHVVHGSIGYHRASIAGKRILLNSGSLDAVKGGPFRGFEAGESYYVAVGAEETTADGAMRFTPFWSGRVIVSAR